METKSKLKYLITCLLSLYVASDSMAVNDLNKIRTSFNQEQKKIRIVFDATKKIDYRVAMLGGRPIRIQSKKILIRILSYLLLKFID